MPLTRVSHVTVTCIRVSRDLVCTAAEHVHKYVDGHDLSKEFDKSVASDTKVCMLHVHNAYNYIGLCIYKACNAHVRGEYKAYKSGIEDLHVKVRLMHNQGSH